MRFLYVTREKHPSFRVDLTQLFSKGMAQGKHHYVEWHTQSLDRSDSSVIQLNDYEKVHLGKYLGEGGIITKILNKFHGFLHELRILTLVKRGDYDFVQVRDKVLAAYIGLIAARRKKIPFYYWLSFPHAEGDVLRASDSSMLISRPMRWFYLIRGKFSCFILYKVVFPRADFVFVQSDRMLEDIEKYGIDRSKMLPIPMGINFEQVENTVLEPIDDDRLLGKKVLMYLGTMVRDRRIEFLVEMMPAIIKKIPNAILLLVGDAPPKDMAFIKDKVKELNLKDSVVFTGFIPMEQGWGYIRASNVCISPFRPSPILDSTSPTKLIEYMAWGRPVVANMHPDQSKVISESGAGFAVDYDVDAFAVACLKLLEDPEAAEEMGKKGVEYVRTHRTYQILTDNLEKQYQYLLSVYTPN